uniref:Uncharacterized protein n=1 Tax=Anopheles culicifacies TaxID=139723 RepID=A0A182MLZ5_9DIPT
MATSSKVADDTTRAMPTLPPALTSSPVELAPPTTTPPPAAPVPPTVPPVTLPLMVFNDNPPRTVVVPAAPLPAPPPPPPAPPVPALIVDCSSGWLGSWHRLAASSFGEVAGVRMPRLSYLMLTGDTPAEVAALELGAMPVEMAALEVGDTGNTLAGVTGDVAVPATTVVLTGSDVVAAAALLAASTIVRGTLWVTCVMVSVDGLVHVELVVFAFVPI